MAGLAQATLGTGDVARALPIALAAVQLDDDSAGAHAVLAKAYLLDGQLQKAASEIDLALARDPDDATAHQIRSELYYTLDGDIRQAIAELQIAAELQPGLWLRHYQLGLLLLEAGEPNPAIVALTDALVLRHKPLTFTTLGRAYYRSSQFEQARSFLEQSLSAGATDANTYALLSIIYARDDRCNDARIYFERALAEDPANGLALEARDTCQGTPPAPASTSAVTPPPAEATPTQPSPPALSGQIAFPVWNAERGQYDTFVARVDGSERTLVAEGMHQPAFRADGQWLAVNGEQGDHMNLFIVRPDGSDLRELTAYLEDSLPCWSPDGQSLVFSSTRHKDRRSRLYIVDQVIFDGSTLQDRVLNSDLYELLGEYPAWMPEGRIVYSGCNYTTTPTRCGLFTISAEQGPQTPEQLTSQPGDTAPAAIAGKVAFMSDRDGNYEIYVVNADGSGLKRLTDNAFNDGLPAWSPNGQAIAFVSDEGGVWAVWAMSADGSNRRKLFDIEGGGLPSDWQHERIAWGP
jgi:tetratricopeptide (TPR) repeat protein